MKKISDNILEAILLDEQFFKEKKNLESRKESDAPEGIIEKSHLALKDLEEQINKNPIAKALLPQAEKIMITRQLRSDIVDKSLFGKLQVAIDNELAGVGPKTFEHKFLTPGEWEKFRETLASIEEDKKIQLLYSINEFLIAGTTDQCTIDLPVLPQYDFSVLEK